MLNTSISGIYRNIKDDKPNPWSLVTEAKKVRSRRGCRGYTFCLCFGLDFGIVLAVLFFAFQFIDTYCYPFHNHKELIPTTCSPSLCSSEHNYFLVLQYWVTTDTWNDFYGFSLIPVTGYKKITKVHKI